MSCGHRNPPGYVFCGTCGAAVEHRRCRCGFVGARDDRFCGRCGADLEEHLELQDGPTPTTSAGRYDLARIIQRAEQDGGVGKDPGAKVDQDDIRRMLDAMKKAN